MNRIILILLLLTASAPTVYAQADNPSGGGGTVGGATEAKQDTIIGHIDGVEATLTTIDSVLDSIYADGATEAKQDTIIGHVDGIEGSLTTIDAVLDTIDAVLDGVAIDVANIASDIGDILLDTAGIETILGNMVDGTSGNAQVDVLSYATCPAADRLQFFGDYSSAQTNTVVAAAPGVGAAWCLTDIWFSNGDVAGEFFLVSDPAGTPVQITGIDALIGGGAVLPVHGVLCAPLNTAVGLTTTPTGSHKVTVLGCKVG